MDTKTGTIQLKATFANAQERLTPGQFLNVVLKLAEEPNAIAVPSVAVQTGQKGQYVFVVKPDKTVEVRSVRVGNTVGSETVIQQGLKTGEQVVTDGQFNLVPNAKVDVKQGLSGAGSQKRGDSYRRICPPPPLTVKLILPTSQFFTLPSSLPSAGFGALLTLMLFHVDLNIYAFVGIILLVGIVKKNGIMMIDFAVEAQQKEGKSPYDAIYEACLVRFRPIMMTTMAALMGTLPIALGFGAGAEARRPLGLAVVGGLVFSQLLTLYITPVFYTYMEAFRKRLEKRGSRALSKQSQLIN